MMKYSNPRMYARIEGWPYGSLRTTATFHIEADQKAGVFERAVRQTVNPKTGHATEPKKLTYSVKQRIVEGEDGRTYIACLTAYGTVSIMRGDMKFQHESFYDKSRGYAEVLALFNPVDTGFTPMDGE